MSYRDFDGREVDGNGRAIAMPEPSRPGKQFKPREVAPEVADILNVRGAPEIQRPRYDRPNEPALYDVRDSAAMLASMLPVDPQAERIIELEASLIAIQAILGAAHPGSAFGNKYCNCALCRAMLIVSQVVTAK